MLNRFRFSSCVVGVFVLYEFSPMVVQYTESRRWALDTSLQRRRSENVAEKRFFFLIFRPYTKSPSYLKGEKFCWNWRGGPRPISERESKIYRLAVPVLKSTQNLVISRCGCAGTAKKCTTKRDARAELLFSALNVLLCWRSRCCRRFVRSLIRWFTGVYYLTVSGLSLIFRVAG